jgi:hypothetical protein
MNTYRKNLTLYYCTPGLVPTREILVAIRLKQYGHGTSGRTKLSCEPACEDEEEAMALSADAADPLSLWTAACSLGLGPIGPSERGNRSKM